MERYAGTEFGEKGNLVEKTCVEIVAVRGQVQEVVDVVIAAAQTGEIGDGKIFLYPIADVAGTGTLPRFNRDPFDPFQHLHLDSFYPVHVDSFIAAFIRADPRAAHES